MDLQAFPGTLGRPILGVSVEVRDRSAIRSPTAPRARSVCAAPYVMLGYWENDAATSDAIRKDRWLHTATSASSRTAWSGSPAAAPT